MEKWLHDEHMDRIIMCGAVVLAGVWINAEANIYATLPLLGLLDHILRRD